MLRVWMQIQGEEGWRRFNPSMGIHALPKIGLFHEYFPNEEKEKLQKIAEGANEFYEGRITFQIQQFEFIRGKDKSEKEN